MIRKSNRRPWREVRWEEAIGYAASEFRRIQDKHGKDSIGGITSSPLHERGDLPRAEADPRRVRQQQRRHLCPASATRPPVTAWPDLRHSAGTQTFKSVEKADVIMVIGANPAAAHPVFASRMKRRLRQGAKLIVVDPRQIDLVKSPHVQADYHLPLKPGTTWP